MKYLMISDPPVKKSYLSVRIEIWICILLVIPTLFIYSQVTKYNFIFIDDNIYVYENPYVKNGFTKQNILKAFSFTKQGDHTYWHPLSIISHMTDCHLFGLQPGRHHLTNLLLHLTNTVLLFLLFRIMTQNIWKSAFIAAIFALHPLNVDTVAWIAERKNLLSTFFWMLTMVAYYHYTLKPGIGRYAAVFLLMITGLLCKPMLVTLPCVLLLMDLWPLNRMKMSEKNIVRSNLHLIIEKLPLLFLSIIWSHLSSLSMQRLELEISTTLIPMDIRISNAIISYVKYFFKMLWPYNLAIYYPYPSEIIPGWKTVSASAILVLITIILFRNIKIRPWLIVGWLWYLGALVPVIGIVQNGLWPEMADRWTYIPMIGIFIIIAWGIPEVLRKWKNRIGVLLIPAIAYFIILSITTWNQTQYWSSNIRLFSHAMDVTQNNVVIQCNLGYALRDQKQYPEAIEHFLEALKFKPNSAGINSNLGNAFMKTNQQSKAIEYYLKAIQIKPDDPNIHNNIGNVFLSLNLFKEASSHYKDAIKLDPDDANAYYNMGLLLNKQKKISHAIDYFKKAVQIEPEYAKAHLALGNALVETGQIDNAIEQYKRALEIDQNLTEAKTNLKIIAEHRKKIHSEISKLKSKIQKTPMNHFLYYQLGNLYEKENDLNNAIKHYQKTITLQSDFFPALKRLAVLHAAQKKYSASISFYKKMIAIQPEKNSLYYNVACLYAIQNETMESIRWLSQSIDKGYKKWELIQTDKDLKNIRKTKEYQKWLENRIDKKK